MTTYDFNINYATSFIDNFGTRIDFSPLHQKGIGSMVTTRPDGYQIGGEYTIREDVGILYLGWKGVEYLFRPTEKGFDLLTGETVQYSYTRIE